MDRHPDWVNPDADLVGVDGNAFAVMGFTRNALKKAGNSKAVIDAYLAEAQAGDYDRLLTVSMCYCGMIDAAVW
jgi:hypothetical protein